MNIDDIEIILVEDNPDDAFFTKRAFIEANVNNQILILTDGEEAINFFFHDKSFANQTFEGKSKLILLDMNLPKVDGMTILTKLKASESTKSIPVVILTATENDPKMKEALALGADSYIIKPVTFEGFLKVVKKLSDKYG
ncbi:MAG TPA: response regulator [Bacteroidia bacterium]|jgi:CheY-like chemotaxis protein